LSTTAVVPENLTSTIQVINLFALVDGLVQALTGEYYNNTAIKIPGLQPSASSLTQMGRPRKSQFLYSHTSKLTTIQVRTKQ
jgi:hypothetical protein